MPNFAGGQLADGTQFVFHQTAPHDFVFEANHGHILSISIHSPDIAFFRDVLASGNDGSTYKRSAIDAGAANLRHVAIHNAGIPYNNNHEHFESRRNSVYDGIPALALIVAQIGAAETLQIIHLAHQT